MYLTRAFLDPSSRAVQADLRSPESLHKTVMRAFPEYDGPSPRNALGVLHRLDQRPAGRIVLLIQSRSTPMTECWPAGYLLKKEEGHGDLYISFSGNWENPAIRSVAAERAAIQAGRRFVFRLLANTTKKIDTKTRPDNIRRHGRRVPVRGDDARMEWLARHAKEAGFAVDARNVRITEIAAAVGRRGKSVTLAGALFDGVLVVSDADRFRAALERGIGPAKAYGFGLLSIAKAS